MAQDVKFLKKTLALGAFLTLSMLLVKSQRRGEWDYLFATNVATGKILFYITA